ncbi:MAG TPA: pilus assembly protein PilM, partial [Candidatus Omnitrophota bacterium]|nr:pilus assembly protein PilM [Candidatus Omnitrophota bacterium]
MASRRKLGINFGPEDLNIVEVEKQRIICHYHIPYLESQDKAEVVDVADQIMLAAVLQKTLREKQIKTDEVIATIPAKEVLLRSFLIPILPQREIKPVIDFEARKYVPIKLDLLSFDYILQKVKEKSGAKFKTHFIGIKQDVLDKFIYSLEQSSLKVLGMETSPLSLFRVLIYKKLAKINSNIAIVETNRNEGNICIIEKGYPHLIRDFKLASISKDIYAKDQETILAVLDKELRHSFDYYRRQTTKYEIDQIFVF